MMTISFEFSYDRNRDGVKTQARFFVDLQYETFPEIQEEFPGLTFPKKEMLELNLTEDEDTVRKTFVVEIERPYGDYKAVCLMQATQEDETDDEKDKKTFHYIGLPAQLQPYFKDFCEPRPVSAAEQERRDNEEEEDNKKKEQQARNKQKQLDEKKAEMRLEKQEAIRKQEQNSAALKVYFRAMNLQLHKSEEDFNASMSILSIYHLELHENFMYYAQPFKGPYVREENELIPLQGFYNFCKVMKLATQSSHVQKYFITTLKDIEGINIPPDDTINVKNGINYAQFLEALLRICMHKSE